MLQSFFKLLIANAFTLFLFVNCDSEVVIDDLDNSYHYNDGPILTITSQTDTSICINWLSSSKIPTIIHYNEINSLNIKEIRDEQSEHIHNICLKNLKPDTTYTYQVWFSNFYSPIYKFHTNTSIDKSKFNFLIFGDMQPIYDEDDEHCRTVLASLNNEQDVSFFIQLGDLTNRGSSELRWHTVLKVLTEFASQNILVPVIGNHDFTYDNGKNWADIFATLPFYNVTYGKYYYFDYHNARFIILDNFENSNEMTVNQYNWLIDTLKNTPADSFIFVFLHLTLFSSGSENINFELQKQLIPIFDRYGVHSVFFGHDHMYEHYIYKYGDNGLIHFPEHNWTHRTIHYFLTGGGGANLEYEYGILNRKSKEYDRTFYSLFTNSYIQKQFIQKPWNSTRYVLWANQNYAPNGYSFYHVPEIEIYQTESEIDGLEYGETSLHYIKVEVFQDKCVISVMYPNGELLEGPYRNHPQIWEIKL